MARKKSRRREAWQTMREYQNQFDDLSPLETLSQAAEVAAYRPKAPEDKLVTNAKGAWKMLKKALK